MSLINQPVTKHKFEGIGETGAAMVMAALAANPKTIALSKGLIGKGIFLAAKLACMGFASLGLVVLNVGAAKIETIVSQGNFDGSWESARKMIDAIKSEGRELTDEEKNRINEPVREAFRKFGRFGRLRKR